MSKSKNKKPFDHIPELLFQAASGFYDIGFSLAFALNMEIKNSISNIQKIAPAAVNMSFSAELFLKGLIMKTTEPKEGHHLHSLFKELEQDLQDQIEKNYIRHQLNNMRTFELSAYRFKIVKSTNKNLPVTKYKFGFPSLEDFLSDHNRSFENWRYLFEVKEKEGYVLDIDFKSFACFINAIMDATKEKMEISVNKI